MHALMVRAENWDSCSTATSSPGTTGSEASVEATGALASTRRHWTMDSRTIIENQKNDVHKKHTIVFQNFE